MLATESSNIRGALAEDREFIQAGIMGTLEPMNEPHNEALPYDELTQPPTHPGTPDSFPAVREPIPSARLATIAIALILWGVSMACIFAIARANGWW